MEKVRKIIGVVIIEAMLTAISIGMLIAFATC